MSAIVATHTDSTGTATVFLHIPDDDDGNRAKRVGQWRLDDGIRLHPVFPETLMKPLDGTR